MNVQQLFEAIGNIDDRFIDEAASDAIPHLKWKVAAVAAAAAAVITGTVLYSTAMLNRPTTTPQDLSAPIITAAPTETVPPNTDPSNPVYITPEQGGDQTTTPVQPTPNQPDTPGSSGGWSAGLPSLPGSGGSGSGALPGLPLPGSGGSGSGALPGIPLPGGSNGSDPPGSGTVTTPAPTSTPNARIHYVGRYSHSAAGDFLIFYELHGVPVLTKNITGQITDGHYAATVYGFPFGQSRYVELQVYDDGSYDLSVS